ncbi:lipid-A-disaccharide synthase [Rhodovulum imhoffii]|uniref:Lipid-A-disaccharide synthase n=2 Tax=Rhodovulum imhoffii TaxID=365340 RepID=A0A2T5BTK9_9RHOB|nr:lipid-A-disaccharide synthase [Rhodovulum imhoffii]PTN02766.1 lipid-A-disaccharide synthase [Rhodovulum imhoffii]
MRRFFLIAGEPSGDALGAALMRGLRQLCPKVRFCGVGGPLMQAAGLESLFPMEELSVMGLAEVLPRYRHLMRRIRQCAQAILDESPDALVTIDSPDFSLRVARRVKAASRIRTVHYVAPTVWAWRPRRAVRMAEVIDHVLALFPFEPPYMEAEGMRCDFVGHPVATRPQASSQDVARFRADHGVGDAPLLLALPGSRMGEVTRLAPVFGAALHPVLARYPQARIVVPSPAPVADTVARLVRNWPGAPVVLRGQGMEKGAAFRAADVALAASGTVSLELAAAGTPMVIAYDMNWLTRQILARILRIDTVTLVNIVSETRAVPEFLGERCQPAQIAGALGALLEDPAARSAQATAAQITMQRLGQGGEDPGVRAARAVLNGL